MDIIELLSDCIMRFEGWDAGNKSRSWRNRNPGNLRPISMYQPHDEKNYRIFNTFSDGWAALRNDVKAKLNGSHGLTPKSTLLEFFNIYAPSSDANNPSIYADAIAKWISAGSGLVVTSKTTLGELYAKDYAENKTDTHTDNPTRTTEV